MKDRQYFRTTLKKDGKSLKLLKQIFPNYKILCWNFWYILKHSNKDIIKIFLEKDFFKKELIFYKIFNKHWILTPILKKTGVINLQRKCNYLVLENVRINSYKLYSYKQIWIKNLINIINQIHSINFYKGKSIVHGNLHPRNFFKQNKNIWIFDFSSIISYYPIEYEFAKIFFYSELDFNLLVKLKSKYIYKNYLSLKKIINFTVEEIIKNIKYNQYNSKDYLENLTNMSINLKSNIKTYQKIRDKF